MSTRVGPPATLLLKITPGERGEARALARGARISELASRSRPSGGLLLIRDAPRQDSIVWGGQRLDLGSAGDRERFAGRLPLDEERQRALAEALQRAPAGSRDELAQLARVLGWAETGKLRLQRLVLSGHWHPLGMRGELEGPRRNGTFDFRDLRRLVQLFPGAARQVRHLMLAICFRGRQPSPAAQGAGAGLLGSYREIFPNLESLTGYGERAHLSGQGAELDLLRWSRATEGKRSPSRAEVFGTCRQASSGSRAEQRRQAGLVHRAGESEQCP